MYKRRKQELVNDVDPTAKTLLRKVRDRISMIEGELLEARKLEDTLRQIVYKDYTSIACAQGLPAEILGLIFEEYTHPDRRSIGKLLFVCRSWHNAAKKHRRLWSKIHLEIPSGVHELDMCLKYIQSQLQNSGGMPLDIHLDYSRAATFDQFCGSTLSAEVSARAKVLRSAMRYLGSTRTLKDSPSIAGDVHRNQAEEFTGEEGEPAEGSSVASNGVDTEQPEAPPNADSWLIEWKDWWEEMGVPLINDLPFQWHLRALYAMPLILVRGLNSEYMPRWRSFEFKNSKRLFGPGELVPLDAPMPILERLVLIGSQLFFLRSISFWRTPGRTFPKLKYLHLDSVDINFNSIAENSPSILDLIIHNIPLVRAPTGIFQLTYLCRLHIGELVDEHLILVDQEIEIDVQRTVFPNLSYICISSRGPMEIYGAIDAPALETLVIVNEWGMRHEEVYKYFNHARRIFVLFPPLSIQVPEYLAFNLQVYTSVDTLVLQSCHAYGFWGLLFKIRNLYKFIPSLQVVEIIAEGPEDWDSRTFAGEFLMDIFHERHQVLHTLYVSST